jgi:uncharacterized membrane protein
MSDPNPYAAPRAPVADAAMPLPGNFVPDGRRLPAARGWAWIAAGWELFKRRPLQWVGAVVIYALIFIALALVPVLGSLATMVLAPVVAGGMVAASRLLDEGRNTQLGDFFAGFRERFGTLISVGLLYLGASVAIALVVGLVTGAGVWTLMGAGDAAAVASAAPIVLLAFLLMLALMLPVFMALWFSPALVMFHGQGALDAMKMSFQACLRNIVPFLVYGLVMLLLSIAASIPFGLGWLILGPVIAASLYAAYRDIFFE